MFHEMRAYVQLATESRASTNQPESENSHMSTHRPAFIESQLFHWEAEPSQERPSAFFDETRAMSAARDRRRKSRGTRILLLIVTLLVGFGVAALIAMKHMLLAWPN